MMTTWVCGLLAQRADDPRSVAQGDADGAEAGRNPRARFEQRLDQLIAGQAAADLRQVRPDVRPPCLRTSGSGCTRPRDCRTRPRPAPGIAAGAQRARASAAVTRVGASCSCGTPRAARSAPAPHRPAPPRRDRPAAPAPACPPAARRGTDPSASRDSAVRSVPSTSSAPCRSASEAPLISDVSCWTFAADDIARPGRMPSAAFRTAGSLSASAVFITCSMSLTFSACSARSEASRTSTDGSSLQLRGQRRDAPRRSRAGRRPRRARRGSPGVLSAFGRPRHPPDRLRARRRRRAPAAWRGAEVIPVDAIQRRGGGPDAEHRRWLRRASRPGAPASAANAATRSARRGRADAQVRVDRPPQQRLAREPRLAQAWRPAPPPRPRSRRRR